MLNGIFDSHAHYDSEDFDPDREELIDSFAAQGVVAVLNASSDIPSSRASMALTERYPFFWCGVGVHPHEAAEVDGDYIDQIEQMCAQPKVCLLYTSRCV